MIKLLNKFINWENIRNLGELQILTRGSYLALILVPIIAGLWPSVRVSINHYNKVAIEATTVLEYSYKDIAQETNKIENLLKSKKYYGPHNAELSEYVKNINKQSMSLLEHVKMFKNRFDPSKLDTPKIPLVWVFAFFGSLFIIIGHTIYQISAPTLIKKYSRLELVESSKIDEFDLVSKTAGELDPRRKAQWRYSGQSTNGSIYVKLLTSLFFLIGLICIGTVISLQIHSILFASGIA